MGFWSKVGNLAGDVTDGIGDGINALTGVTQARAARGAAAAQERAANRAITENTRLHEQGRADLMPWVNSGAKANDTLARLFAPGGQLLKTYGGDYNAKPFEFDVNSDPGAAFRMDQSNKALERSAAGRHRSLGGNAIRSLAEFNQGLASQEYGSAYDRYNTDRSYGLSEYTTNRNFFNSDQQALFSRLFGISGQGQASAAGQASQNNQFGDALSGLFTGIGNAQAAGKIGAANAKSDAMGNLLNLGSQAAVAAFI